MLRTPKKRLECSKKTTILSTLGCRRLSLVFRHWLAINTECTGTLSNYYQFIPFIYSNSRDGFEHFVRLFEGNSVSTTRPNHFQWKSLLYPSMSDWSYAPHGPCFILIDCKMSVSIDSGSCSRTGWFGKSPVVLSGPHDYAQHIILLVKWLALEKEEWNREKKRERRSSCGYVYSTFNRNWHTSTTLIDAIYTLYLKNTVILQF